ncbi:hypothetical protein HQ560_13265 [bacterium]|nr:hypothetical protein [bacterium]
MHALRLTVVSVLLMAAGCGDGTPAVDEAPFRAAVVAYLKRGSMDMRPDAFLSLEVDGETATAVVRMATKEEIGYGLKPKWTIPFRREGGVWKMTTYDPG